MQFWIKSKRFISDELELCCENVFHVYRSSIQMVFPKYWNDVKLEKEKSLQIDFSVSIDKIDFRSTITKNVIRSWEEAQVCFIFDDPRKAWKFLIFHSLKPFFRRQASRPFPMSYLSANYVKVQQIARSQKTRFPLSTLSPPSCCYHIGSRSRI